MLDENIPMKDIDDVYWQRNRLVAVLARCFPSKVKIPLVLKLAQPAWF